MDQNSGWFIVADVKWTRTWYTKATVNILSIIGKYLHETFYKKLSQKQTSCKETKLILCSKARYPVEYTFTFMM